ncbi:MAG: hypothetical protein HXK96_02645 [Candidatus Nanogingivalaceae bacterium]|nr:hypothetical protein [Candidatus Nanogingivalaceae bacterium]
MKNKVIISAIIAFFAVAGIAILPNGMNAHALSPEEEERIYLVTIDKQIAIVAANAKKANSYEEAKTIMSEYKTDLAAYLAELTDTGKNTVMDRIKLAEKEIADHFGVVTPKVPETPAVPENNNENSGKEEATEENKPDANVPQNSPEKPSNEKPANTPVKPENKPQLVAPETAKEIKGSLKAPNTGEKNNNFELITISFVATLLTALSAVVLKKF